MNRVELTAPCGLDCFKKLLGIVGIAWLLTTVVASANPIRKTIWVDGIEREYLVYAPVQSLTKKADGIIVCLHGFGRSMYDFFDVYNITSVPESLNMLIVAPQALGEQNKDVIEDANFINSITNNQLSLHSVWGCGLRVRVTLQLLGTTLLNDELNKDVDDVKFIDQMIDATLSDYSLPDENIFVLGTSMGGFMTYQYALKKGKRLSGVISIAGSMGLNIEGMDYGVQIPVCDFHSVTDEVVPYTGSYSQSLSVFFTANITLAKPKAEVIDYWTKTNATGFPVTVPIQYYPSTKGISVEKITYPHPVNEVIHYKINGASHSYFFKKEAGDCMDHVEEITRFIQPHLTGTTHNEQFDTGQKPFFYPNPVENLINFAMQSGVITIYDMTGSVVFAQSFSDGQADISSLKSGVYVIRVQAGNVVYTSKMVKK